MAKKQAVNDEERDLATLRRCRRLLAKGHTKSERRMILGYLTDWNETTTDPEPGPDDLVPGNLFEGQAGTAEEEAAPAKG